jgi:hypothetical protein
MAISAATAFSANASASSLANSPDTLSAASPEARAIAAWPFVVGFSGWNLLVNPVEKQEMRSEVNFIARVQILPMY